MAVKFFGQFMVEKGAVSRHGLLKAIELQESTNIKLGEMALSMGFITNEGIKRVHEGQRFKDLRFGDMAVKLGILTQNQLEQVLTKQKNNHLYIGEALIKVGELTAADLLHYLEEFKADQAPYMIDKVAIPEGVPNCDIWEISADLTYKMFTRIVGLTFRPGQCQIVKRTEQNDVIVAIDMTGHVNGCYLLSVSSGVRKFIARAILQDDDVSNEPDEVLNDTVMEFMNIVCGNIAAKAAQLGKIIEIAPPEIIDQGEDGGLDVPARGTGLKFPLYVTDEKVEVGIFLLP